MKSPAKMAILKKNNKNKELSLAANRVVCGHTARKRGPDAIDGPGADEWMRGKAWIGVLAIQLTFRTQAPTKPSASPEKYAESVASNSTGLQLRYDAPSSGGRLSVPKSNSSEDAVWA